MQTSDVSSSEGGKLQSEKADSAEEHQAAGNPSQVRLSPLGGGGGGGGGGEVLTVGTGLLLLLAALFAALLKGGKESRSVSHPDGGPEEKEEKIEGLIRGLRAGIKVEEEEMVKRAEGRRGEEKEMAGGAESVDRGEEREERDDERAGPAEGGQSSEIQHQIKPFQAGDPSGSPLQQQQLEGESALRVEEGRPAKVQEGHEIILQAFSWESHKTSPSFWEVLKDKVTDIAAAGFTSVWLPPASDSLAPQGYLPRDLYSLHSAYGSEPALRALLSALREAGVGACADVVLNHRIGSVQSAGGLYTRYDGMPLPWDETAVTSDTGGQGQASTGDVFQGVPNIDHTQERVRRDISEWLKWLRRDVGFHSFRFDYAKGYSPEFVKEYIAAGEPALAVGEFWDACNYSGDDYQFDYDQDSHRQRIRDWIERAGGTACAFDFTTKGILQEAVRRKEWWRLKDPQGRPSGFLGLWPERAVTFVENHDTGSTQAHWPFPSEHILQGYAYILTHPGQPTVFYDHIYEWGDEVRGSILQLMEVRRRAGICSSSVVDIWQADSDIYVAAIGRRLLLKLGEAAWPPPEGAGWDLAVSGNGFAVWTAGAAN